MRLGRPRSCRGRHVGSSRGRPRQGCRARSTSHRATSTINPIPGDRSMGADCQTGLQTGPGVLDYLGLTQGILPVWNSSQWHLSRRLSARRLPRSCCRRSSKCDRAHGSHPGYLGHRLPFFSGNRPCSAWTPLRPAGCIKLSPRRADDTQRDARRTAASALATARTATALQRDIQHSAPQSALAPAGRRTAASALATARTATALQRDIQHSAPQSALAPAGRRTAASALATARTATALQRDIQHSAPQSALAPAGRRTAASALATARTATALQRDIQRAARGTGRAARLPY